MKHSITKRTALLTAVTACALTATAQVTVAEPEFIGSYQHLTSDSTCEVLPKESGTMKTHENKARRFSKIASGMSGLAGAAGVIGVASAGSLSGVVNSARLVQTASGVGMAASSVNTLAGASGMDIVFQGKSSSYTVKLADGDLRFVVREEEHETDPAELYRIVRLKTSKKERRVQWMEYSPALLGTEEAEENGYIGFRASKYGEQSYLLTVPQAAITEGQYGIFYVNVSTATTIPVATFCVE